MKVLLINPTRTGSDSYINPPLHLMYIAQAVRKTGHEADILDIHYRMSKKPDASQSKADYEGSMIEEVLGREFDVLGVGSIVSAYDFTKRLVNAVKSKRPGVPIIIGGGMSIALKDLWEEKTGIDYLVESDGEVVIQRFLQAYPDAEALSKIPGLYMRQGGRFSSLHRPELPTNLDYIDMPDWGLLEGLDDYMAIQRKWVNNTLPPEMRLSENDRVLPIVMTRGCPYKCTFCYHVNNFHRRHSPQYVADYLLRLKEEHRLTFVVTWDDLIMANRKWLSDLCDEIIARKVGLKIFTSGGKPNLVTRELLVKMREAGFVRVSYGIESGSQKVLDIMRKRTTVEQNYNAVKMGIQEGIFVHLNMVLGMPGETISTLRETFRFLTSLAGEGLITSKNVSFSFATGYPGTALYQHMLDNRIVTDTEEYLRNQTGVGEYKYNLCGISVNRMRFMRSHATARMNFLYYMRHGQYARAFSSYFSKAVKSVVVLAAPPSILNAMKKLIRKG